MRTRPLNPPDPYRSHIASAQAAFAQQGPGDPIRGGELFVANCAVCHGVSGQGRVGASLEEFPGIDPTAAIEATIASGVAGSVMPAWSQAKGGPLSEQDIHDIAAIVAAFGGPANRPFRLTLLRRRRLAECGRNPSAGPSCIREAWCAGAQGRGRFGCRWRRLAVHRSSDLYSAGRHRWDQGTVMPTWGKAGGGPLSDENIADVAAFVLTLKPGSSRRRSAAGRPMGADH
jgi:mono/diheme cytochrome c family protein